MPTIKEIAKACNVSVATVSNIINHKGSVGDATRERVEKVIREMNYTPNYVAKNLKTKNTRSIGVIAEDMTVFALPDIIDGITEYCEEADYQILLVGFYLQTSTLLGLYWVGINLPFVRIFPLRHKATLLNSIFMNEMFE